MKNISRVFTSLLLICFFVVAHSQDIQSALTPQAIQTYQAKRDAMYKWANWDQFIGTFKGEGTGTAGSGLGQVTFTKDLNNRILTIKSDQNFGATKDHAAFTYQSIMIVYVEGLATKANFYDNEGHYLVYDVQMDPKAQSVTFVSEPAANTPKFKFSWTVVDKGTLKGVFNVAPIGSTKYVTHIEGTAKRVQ